MLQIGVISRLTIDLLFPGLTHLPGIGEEVRAQSFSAGLGGGPAVTAVRLGRMGMPVKLGTFLDDSLEARYAQLLLRQQGMEDYINLYRGSWRPVTVSAVMPCQGDRSIVSYEEAPQELSQEELLPFFSDCGIAVIPMLPKLAGQIKARGGLVVMDTTDFDCPMPLEQLSLLDTITPNLKEAAAITGQKLPGDALAALAKAGVRRPLIKLGEKGCMILEGGQPRIVPPVEGLESVDTTGAGDNFLAGLLFGYARGWTLRQCVGMANVFGGLSTTAVGVFGADITQEKAMEVYRACYGPLPEGGAYSCAI